jgi:RNA polymerase sigma factor (sigma-70 family)
MKIADPGPAVIQRATQGDLAALDATLLAIQPGVFNLAVRMLGNREDAADATQEILLKVVTHLGSFRQQAAFTTWVFQIARNHLLTASTRSRESPEVSLEALGERLEQGLATRRAAPAP